MSMQVKIAEYVDIFIAYILGGITIAMVYEGRSFFNTAIHTITSFNYKAWMWEHAFGLTLAMFIALLSLGMFMLIVEVTTPPFQQKTSRKIIGGIAIGLSLSAFVLNIVIYYNA